MHCEETAVLRRKKRPPPLRLTSVLKVIRRSIAGVPPPPRIEPPVKSASPIEITSFSPVLSPRHDKEDIFNGIANHDTSNNISPMKLLSVSTSSFSSRDSNSSISSHNVSSSPASPFYKEPNNNNNNFHSPKLLFPGLVGSLENEIAVTGLLLPSPSRANSIGVTNLTDGYVPDLDPSDEKGSPTSSSSESNLTPSFRSLSLSRTNNFNFEEPLIGASEERGSTCAKNAKEGKTLSSTYATIRHSKLKKKAAKRETAEQILPKLTFTSVDDNIHCKEDLPPAVQSRGRRATVGQIYRNEKKKRNGKNF